MTSTRRIALLLLLLIISGCATPQQPEVERSERQAAIERWSRCIERRAAAVPMNTDAQAKVSEGCEGHRRDVVMAFPPHMKRRLERMLDEREARLTRSSFVQRVTATSGDEVIEDLAESLSDN